MKIKNQLLKIIHALFVSVLLFSCQMQVDSKKSDEVGSALGPAGQLERRLTAVEIGQQALELWYDECLDEFDVSTGENLVQYCDDSDFTDKALLYYDDLMQIAVEANYFEGLTGSEYSIAIRRINERSVEDSYCYYRGERCLNGYPDGPFDPEEAFKNFEPEDEQIDDDTPDDEVNPDDGGPDDGYSDDQDITIIINIIFNFNFDSSFGSCTYVDFFGETQVIPNGEVTYRLDGTELNCINGHLISDF